MYYSDGSFAGINEMVFNFKPWLDWYLKETGQHLVGGNAGKMMPDVTTGASKNASATGNTRC